MHVHLGDTKYLLSGHTTLWKPFLFYLFCMIKIIFIIFLFSFFNLKYVVQNILRLVTFWAVWHTLTSSNLIWVSLLLCSSPLALMTTTKPQDLYLVKPSRDSLCLVKKVLMVGCIIFVLFQFQYYGMNWRKMIFRQAFVKERCDMVSPKVLWFHLWVCCSFLLLCIGITSACDFSKDSTIHDK